MANFLSNYLTNFGSSRDGNFAIAAALILPIAFMAGSFALDTSNAFSMKTNLQNAADSAALATSTKLMQEKGLSLLNAEEYAEKFALAQLKDSLDNYQVMSIVPKITITPTIDGLTTVWKVTVALEGNLTATPMARFFGKDTMSINVSGASESASGASKGSASLMLVLDKSGSMGWSMDGQIKIAALKTAVIGLLAEFKLADPEEIYVRIGGVSYDTKIDKKQPLKWGTKYAGKFVDKLEAKDGTDSTDAFRWALEEVTDAKEEKEHAKASGQKPKKYIVFMTDGDNNYMSADSSTKILCNEAKKGDVVVYTVAFAAPTRGQQLLSDCAYSASHFFDAKNSVELIEAFKQIGQQASKVVSRLTN
jgi:Flp pilus assembly protein TadG/uncharacterized protein YegL